MNFDALPGVVMIVTLGLENLNYMNCETTSAFLWSYFLKEQVVSLL
jgi:hypothetical protein